MSARSPQPIALLLAIVGIFALTASYAADSRLDDAVAHLVKTRALITAALPSSASAAFLQHAHRAEQLVSQAIEEINLAKAASVGMPQTPTTRPQMNVNPSGLLKLNPQPEPPSPATVR